MSGIEHVFVLMLENRSFDHMLGFSGITGTDAESGGRTAIRGLTGQESNNYAGQDFAVMQGAGFVMPADPGHEFPNIVHQLCGPTAAYPRGGPYPAADNSGFVASYAASGGQGDPGQVMHCYSPDQLPILNALAREFVVCDSWHASLPGPTWPNRMFVHAASSGGLDHSPTTVEIAQWETIDGFTLPNGTIFDRLQAQGIRRCIYGGDDFPMVAALKHLSLDDIRHFNLFAADVAQANYPAQYIFIEPSYDVLHDYKDGTSQHPLADVTHGEVVMKSVYEAIRNSPAWPTSLLIITWDEHGGFYDHMPPPPAMAPGDTAADDKNNQNGFTFEQYGPRVPALVISPLIPQNLIDHRLYDHASIPATLEALFGVQPLTARDANANHVDALVTLAAARTDAPERLPAPATSAVPQAAALSTALVSRPDDAADEGNLPAVVHSAMRQDLAISPDQRAAIVARVGAIQTREDARQYLAAVQAKVRSVRAQAASE